jgi:hypothetical protein
MSVTLQVYREGIRSSVHSLLKIHGGESMNLEGLFTLFGWLGFLKAQVPELVGDKVELAKGDPLA